jgi:hypothetical protein
MPLLTASDAALLQTDHHVRFGLTWVVGVLAPPTEGDRWNPVLWRDAPSRSSPERYTACERRLFDALCSDRDALDAWFRHQSLVEVAFDDRVANTVSEEEDLLAPVVARLPAAHREYFERVLALRDMECWADALFATGSASVTSLSAATRPNVGGDIRSDHFMEVMVHASAAFLPLNEIRARRDWDEARAGHPACQNIGFAEFFAHEQALADALLADPHAARAWLQRDVCYVAGDSIPESLIDWKEEDALLRHVARTLPDADQTLIEMELAGEYGFDFMMGIRNALRATITDISVDDERVWGEAT